MTKKEIIKLKLSILKDIQQSFDWNLDLNNKPSKPHSFFSLSKLNNIIDKYEYILEGMDYNEN